MYRIDVILSYSKFLAHSLGFFFFFYAKTAAIHRTHPGGCQTLLASLHVARLAFHVRLMRTNKIYTSVGVLCMYVVAAAVKAPNEIPYCFYAYLMILAVYQLPVTRYT